MKTAHYFEEKSMKEEIMKKEILPTKLNYAFYKSESQPQTYGGRGAFGKGYRT
jgi:hypothetical protein